MCFRVLLSGRIADLPFFVSEIVVVFFRLYTRTKVLSCYFKSINEKAQFMTEEFVLPSALERGDKVAMATSAGIKDSFQQHSKKG